ncbi:hypothetical protein BGZ46_005368 [Entomortierella lignicola]|nr:hypothetical protein BGZ46_005368 [Entomortierella lignicola]
MDMPLLLHQDETEDGSGSDTQPRVIRKHKTHYRAFRKDTPEELSLLKAISAHPPFTAKYGERTASWERVVNWLHNHDDARAKQTPPKQPLFSGIQVRTCRLAWTSISKEFALYQKSLKAATEERIQLIGNLYRAEQDAIDSANTQKNARARKQGHVVVQRRREEPRNRAKSMEIRCRQRSESIGSSSASSSFISHTSRRIHAKRKFELARNYREKQMELQK